MIKVTRYRKRTLVALTHCLRDQRGFMLAEQLVSIILIGLLCIVISAGMGAAMSAYGSITRQTVADNLLARAVETVSDEMAYARSVEGGGEFPAYVSAGYRETVQFYDPDAGFSPNGIMLATSTASVTLVPSQDGLIPVLDSVIYDETANAWTFDVSIREGESLPPLAEASLSVKRIGS